jgi:hypothetical protein
MPDPVITMCASGVFTDKHYSGRTSLNCDRENSRAVAKAALALTCLLSAAALAFAEESARPATEKWRPKDGVYAEPGASFNARCGEFGDTVIELAEKWTSGGEEGCKIIKLTDTSPGAIRLDVTCTEIDRETPYKEIIVLKKMDEKTIFLRETQNEKFKRPGGPFSYCPEEFQRAYIEQKTKK